MNAKPRKESVSIVTEPLNGKCTAIAQIVVIGMKVIGKK
jgi:hypothetical protein